MSHASALHDAGPGTLGPGAARARLGTAFEWLLLALVGTALALRLPVESLLRRATLPLLLAAGALALGRRAGGRAAVRVALASAAAGFALELGAVSAGTFAHRVPAALWVWVPLGWAAFALPVVTLSLASRGGTTRRSACAAAAMMSAAMLWDPLGVRAGVFTWPGGGGFAPEVVGFDGSRGIPAASFLAWGAVAACAAATTGTRVESPRDRSALLPFLVTFLALAVKSVRTDVTSSLAPAVLAAALALHLAGACERGDVSVRESVECRRPEASTSS